MGSCRPSRAVCEEGMLVDHVSGLDIILGEGMRIPGSCWIGSVLGRGIVLRILVWHVGFCDVFVMLSRIGGAAAREDRLDGKWG